MRSKFHFQGVFSITGEVTVSVGGVPAAIKAAIDASTGAAFFIDTSTSAALGGVDDGGAITEIVASDGTFANTFVGTLTWNEAQGAISHINAKYRLNMPAGLASNFDIYMVISASDSQWCTVGGNSNSDFLGVADSFAGPPSTVAVDYFFDGVEQTPATRPDYRALFSGGKKVLSLRNAPSATFNTLTIGGLATNTSFNFAGLVADIVVVDAQSDASADAIEATLAARHGITL